MKQKFISAMLILSLLAAVFAIGGCSSDNEKETGTAPETSSITETSSTEPEKTTYSEQQLEKLIAFSFDDGPGGESTGKILDVLERYGFTATFFVVGRNIEESNEHNLKRAVELGCEIGNHTWNHNLKLNSQSQSYVDAEIRDTNAKVKEITGVEPKLVRIPGGLFKDLNVNIGYPIINWTVDTNDWKKKGSAGNAQAASDLADYILNQVDGVPGAIVLMHDIYRFSAETVETVMPKLARAGYKVVSVSELAEAYEVEMKPDTVYRRFERVIKIEPGEFIVSTKTDPLSFRDAPNGKLLTKIPKGTRITVLSSKDGWAEVNYDGRIGWVSISYITPAEAQTATN